MDTLLLFFQKRSLVHLLALLVVISFSSSAQTIIQFAGTGSAGSSGDGGPATDARIYWLGHMVFDGSGNLYIADQNNHRIRKVNTSGIITTVAGNGTNGFSGDGGPATSAALNYPASVAVDGAGNIHIVDSHNQRIRKVSPSGIISTIAGTGELSVSSPATGLFFVSFGTFNPGKSSYFLNSQTPNQ